MTNNSSPEGPIGDSSAPLRRLKAVFRRAHDVVAKGGALNDVIPLLDEALSAAREVKPVGDEEARGELRDLLQDLQLVSAQAGGASTAEPARNALALALVQTQARILRRVTRRACGFPLRDDLPLLTDVLDDLEENVREDRAEEATDQSALEADVAAVRLHLLQSEGERRLRRAKDLLATGRSRSLEGFSAARSLAALRAEIRRESQSHDDEVSALRDELETTKDALDREFLDWLRTDDTAESVSAAVAAAREMAAELEEMRATAALSKSRPHRVTTLNLEKDAARLAAACRSVAKRIALLDPDDQGRARKAFRRLNRFRRRFQDFESDVILSERLEGLFGPRLVRNWDRLIFWLLVAVLALIVVDHYIDPWLDVEEQEVGGVRGGIPWTVWADTAICVVFLVDFFVRMGLSPRRWRYLRRHFFTELLPSIPFAYVSVALNEAVALNGARLIHFLRLARFLRPLMRLVRALLFMTRTLDRLVEQNAGILNRNILFFSDGRSDEGIPTELKRARELDRAIRRDARRAADALGIVARRTMVRALLAFLEREISHPVVADGELGVFGSRLTAEDIRVEDVIQSMRELDEEQVAEFIGVDTARQLAAALSVLRLPLLRRFTPVRFVLGPMGAPDPLGTAARLGRLAGDLLGALQRLIHWFADFYGTITGAQFLDRMGDQLVKLTSRPAKRLLVLGGVTALLVFFVNLLRLTKFAWIKAINSFLFKFFSLPVLVIGLLAAVPMLIGFWLKRIAGQAAEFYERVAEAQFLALTEILKEEHRREDIHTLMRRVFLPEVRLCRPSISPEEEEALSREVESLEASLGRPRESGRLQGLPEEEWVKCQLMLLFYRDFIDGAYFHRNDTKILNILLGNLTLENVRRDRLAWDKKTLRRLDQLDVSRGKGGISGPYVWFNFITHAVSQQVARLIIEYNQNAVPIKDLAALSPEEKTAFVDWCELKRRVRAARRGEALLEFADRERIEGRGLRLAYRTTEFNALHFLSPDPRRDEAVRRRYGDDVADALVDDRRHLIREIFGTYPLHEWPHERRVLNPYAFYGRYLAGGKVFLFPLVVLGWGFKVLRFLYGRFVETVKDLRHPEEKPIDVSKGMASFEVAQRKVRRMRRPVVMEAFRLRAAFDVQYLGLSWPGRQLTVDEKELAAEDLAVLDATEREWEELRELSYKKERQLRALDRAFVHRVGEDGVWEDLLRGAAGAQGCEGEALRALVTAFCCDHRKTWSLVSSFEELGTLLRDILDGAVTRRRRFPPLKRVIRRIEVLIAPLVSHLPRLQALEPEEKARVLEKLCIAVAERPRLERSLTASRSLHSGLVHPYDTVMDVLLRTARRPGAWTEQIVAVRTIQTLGMLDLQGYENLIFALGEYGD